MNRWNLNKIYQKLKESLDEMIKKHHWGDKTVSIRCQGLTAEEAIGKPIDKDYPIQKGKEKIVEATFLGSRGHAFSDEYGNVNYTMEELLRIPLDTNKNRASFVASLNAIYRHLHLCDRTVHCRDEEPRECSKHVFEYLDCDSDKQILLIGYQPRFLEVLSKRHIVRVIDLAKDNVGKFKGDVKIEPSENTESAISWADLLFVTGSTLVNGTIINFIDCKKPVVFYGVTISAAAKILNLKTYCYSGH